MDYKKITIIGFILTCMAQLYVPAKMISDQKALIKTGTLYKFRTAPIDPNDPFRGKYIVLRFADNRFPVRNEKKWKPGNRTYVELERDKKGFAKIKNVTLERPEGTDYVQATIANTQLDKDMKLYLVLSYPFNRYYMNEFKAPQAEQAYREANRDSLKNVYALVYVKNGSGVLDKVMIDDKPIEEVIEE